MDKPSDSTIQSICQSFNNFAVEMFRQVGDQNDNTVFSPFSIAMALAMTSIGAKETTSAEITSTLQLSETPEVLSSAAAAIMEAMLTNDPKGKNLLHLANALWMKQGYSILEAYRNAIRVHFKGELFDVDFSVPEAVRQQVNSWVAKQTNNKIPQLLSAGAPSPGSVLVLTNAIYFLGTWLRVFPARNTENMPFYMLTGRSTKVPTMHIEATFGYAEDTDLQYLEMPYVGDTLAMGVVLPKERASLLAVQGKLSAEQLATLARHASRQRVSVFLPKFKLDSTFDLAANLARMGIRAAFQPDKADFSGITIDPAGVFISAVIHKAFVDVNEKGTEAAAATAISMLPSAAPGGGHHEPPTFRADHPFLFLIRHNRLNAILFLGKVLLPQK